MDSQTNNFSIGSNHILIRRNNLNKKKSNESGASVSSVLSRPLPYGVYTSRKNKLPENAKLYYSNKCFLNSLKCIKIAARTPPQTTLGELTAIQIPVIYIYMWLGTKKLGSKFVSLLVKLVGCPSGCVSDLTGNILANFDIAIIKKKIFLNNRSVEK